MRNRYSRRKFIEKTLGAGIVIAGASMDFSQLSASVNEVGLPEIRYDPKGLPTAVLGKTGVSIPRIAIGLGSRFCNIQGIDINELVRFALSLDGPDGIVIGMDSKNVVESNLNLLRNFKVMNSDEKLKYAIILSPYFRHENLEWMRNGYHDGY